MSAVYCRSRCVAGTRCSLYPFLHFRPCIVKAHEPVHVQAFRTKRESALNNKTADHCPKKLTSQDNSRLQRGHVSRERRHIHFSEFDNYIKAVTQLFTGVTFWRVSTRCLGVEARQLQKDHGQLTTSALNERRPWPSGLGLSVSWPGPR